MIQKIIVYAILSATLFFTVRWVVRTVKKPHCSCKGCSGCHCCKQLPTIPPIEPINPPNK